MSSPGLVRRVIRERSDGCSKPSRFQANPLNFKAAVAFSSEDEGWGLCTATQPTAELWLLSLGETDPGEQESTGGMLLGAGAEVKQEKQQEAL